MSVLANSAVISGDSVIDTGDIGHSLRCRSAASAYLSRTPGVADTTLTKAFIFGWIKRGSLADDGGYLAIISAGTSGGAYSAIGTSNSSGGLQLVFLHDGLPRYTTTAVLRDPTSFAPISVRLDSTASAGSRCKFFIGNTELATTVNNEITLNDTFEFGNTTQHNIGRIITSSYFDGYMARLCMVTGASSNVPTDFIKFNTTINEWVSKSQSEVKAVVDAGGTNSSMLDFDDATSLTTLGYDKSSHGNNWTLNNFSLTPGVAYDHMLDVPGNSYATLSPLVVGHSTLTNGNLTASGTGDLPTITPNSGTWYFERGGVSQTWTPPAAFPSAADDYNFGQRPFTNTPTYPTLCQANLDAAGTVTVSGTFTGNASADGPCVWMNGVPKTLTINSNAVTFGTDADKLATGFKVRTSSASYNTAGSNTWTATIDSDLQNIFKYNNAEGNP